MIDTNDCVITIEDLGAESSAAIISGSVGIGPSIRRVIEGIARKHTRFGIEDLVDAPGKPVLMNQNLIREDIIVHTQRRDIRLWKIRRHLHSDWVQEVGRDYVP